MILEFALLTSCLSVLTELDVKFGCGEKLHAAADTSWEERLGLGGSYLLLPFPKLETCLGFGFAPFTPSAPQTWKNQEKRKQEQISKKF